MPKSENCERRFTFTIHQDNNSSTLRDLLSSDQRDEDSLLGWGDTDVQVKAMHSVDTSSKFEAKHQWLCGGIVLKLENPSAPDNIELFKVGYNAFN